MALDLGDALSYGLDRATKRNAAVVLVAFLAIGLIDTAVTQTVIGNLVEELIAFAREQGELETARQLEELRGGRPLALPISTGQATAVGVTVFVVGETVRVITDRTFVSDETRGFHEPGRNLLAATLNSVVMSVVVGVLLAVGVALLVLPGIFVAVVFFFARQEIAVEDKNAIDALSDSVSLTKGHRLEVFSLAVALFLVEFTVSLVAATVAGGLAGAVINVVLVAAVGVFASATAAGAYRQLRDERERDPDEPVAPGDDGDGDDEWDDPPGVDL